MSPSERDHERRATHSSVDVRVIASGIVQLGRRRESRHDVLVHDHEPAVDLTPAVTQALDRLRPSANSQRGVDLYTVSPLRDWTHALDSEQLAAHLGIVLPTFPP